jgi:hypothetical protein
MTVGIEDPRRVRCQSSGTQRPLGALPVRARDAASRQAGTVFTGADIAEHASSGNRAENPSGRSGSLRAGREAPLVTEGKVSAHDQPC